MQKSVKTLNRIFMVQEDLISHKQTVELLDAYAEGKLIHKVTYYPDINVKYKRTAQDEERYRWTRANIKNQIATLERELEVLNEYGA